MSGFSSQDIEKVREAIDFAAVVGTTVSLRPKGGDLWGCCPFHGEKTPSFKISPDTKLWHCFGCGEGGDVFSYVMKRDNISFPEAVEDCAKIAGVVITKSERDVAQRGKKARLKEVCAQTADFYHKQLTTLRDPAAQRARDYLTQRGFSIDVAKRWNIGFAPGNQALIRYLSSCGFTQTEMIEANVAIQQAQKGYLRDRFFNRIMFPICDAQGDVIAFGGRVIGAGEPKYLNSQETTLFHKSNVLFGLDKAKATIASQGEVVIVEGYTDVISLFEAGLKNVVATLGTALTVQHIRLLSRHAKRRIIYLFDGDEAGKRAADRAAHLIDESMLPEAGRTQVELFAATLPEGLDPAEYVAQYGAQALSDLIARDAKPLLAYALDRICERHDMTEYPQRAHALREMLDILAPIKDSLYAKTYAEATAVRLHMDVADVLARLAKTHKPQKRGNISSQVASIVPTDSTQVSYVSAQTPQFELNAKQKNRLRLESQFLFICATHPAQGRLWSAWIGALKWHRKIHSTCAKKLQEFFADSNEEPSSASILALLVEADHRIE
ncbi:MAG: DNA primase, partial [Eggerthellaceae bacterium]|nr:DNA primase [Eggerthellaceae bacterium]